MGCVPSTLSSQTTTRFLGRHCPSITDKFSTREEVTEALKTAGLESCQLIVGVDFTKSNEWTGGASFEGKCLHALDGPPNPYLTVLSLIARTVEPFDIDNLIPCYGFGDESSREEAVFSFKRENQPTKGIQDMTMAYRTVASHVKLAGPTSFAPLIRQAMKDVYNNAMGFTILLIVADGQISPKCLKETVSAITEASKFPLSIVMIGVGDGSWDVMHKFDDKLPRRGWDNFQFVEFNKYFKDKKMSTEEQEARFLTHALMEVPEQYNLVERNTGTKAKAKVEHIIKKISVSVLEPSFLP